MATWDADAKTFYYVIRLTMTMKLDTDRCCCCCCTSSDCCIFPALTHNSSLLVAMRRIVLRFLVYCISPLLADVISVSMEGEAAVPYRSRILSCLSRKSDKQCERAVVVGGECRPTSKSRSECRSS